jgi:DNA invertase Pin-like site-specific DNA recombinase
MSDKIKPHHLARKALLYVRQSSTHQVLHNRESQALQYAMRDRLVALGWSEVDTVDDDLGRSAAGGVTRVGFERMVAEVCLGKVGAVAAREVSRFARCTSLAVPSTAAPPPSKTLAAPSSSCFFQL